VNAPITRLFVLMLVLFAALVGFTSYWSVFDSDELKGETANRRPLIIEQTVQRGFIKTADGATIAESSPEGGGNPPIYVRRYPQGSLYANPVGYSFVQSGQTGIERSENAVLAGERNEFASILDQLRGVPQEGDNLTLTIDSQAQRVGTEALLNAIASNGIQGAGGAVVALEPSTGAVKAMASVPGYDPNTVTDPEVLKRLNKESSGAPLVNRATQSVYPPGSTMKVLTAAAALDSGEFTPDTVLSGASPQNIGGVPLFNSGGESFGDIDMTTALTNSVNTYWAQVGERIGRDTLVEYMRRFGFYEDPELDYPDGQMIPSGIINGKGEYVDDGFDVGRVAIGQGGLEGEIRASPLQMALVAATVGNHGRLMRPRLTDRIVRKDGRVKERIQPDLQSVVMKPDTAEELAKMMSRVVEEGTGTAAALSGITVAGKTGTAETGANAEFTQAWFICFAPVENPRMAVAVTIPNANGQGGTVAAPIAKSVLEAMIGGGGGG
jgi:peptidoglycan glycosyltransferase